MRVVVTGAGGFIGENTVKLFRERHHDVVGWDRIPHKDAIDTRYVDLSSPSSIANELKENVPDIIVHCAGSADVQKSIADPSMDFESSVRILHNLLFSIKNAGLTDTKIVFMSSAGVYGEPFALPISENMSPCPLSPYAVHKEMCEVLCKFFLCNYNMNIVVARVFSAYGEGLRKQIFWDMYQKIKRTGKLEMMGTGNESRDFIHVNDVVQAIYILATQTTDRLVYNVANGEEITIRRVAELFVANIGMNKDAISFSGVSRKGDPLNWRADISAIKNIGYEKTIGIQEGISRYINWLDRIQESELKWLQA